MVTDQSTTSKHIMFFLFAADKTNTDSDSVECVCPMHDIDLHLYLMLTAFSAAMILQLHLPDPQFAVLIATLCFQGDVQPFHVS